MPIKKGDGRQKGIAGQQVTDPARRVPGRKDRFKKPGLGLGEK